MCRNRDQQQSKKNYLIWIIRNHQYLEHQGSHRGCHFALTWKKKMRIWHIHKAHLQNLHPCLDLEEDRKWDQGKHQNWQWVLNSKKTWEVKWTLTLPRMPLVQLDKQEKVQQLGKLHGSQEVVLRLTISISKTSKKEILKTSAVSAEAVWKV